MFRLFRINRAIKLIAEYAYVGVGWYSVDEYDDGVAIQFYTRKEFDADYSLVIPFDKLDSVIERMQEAKRKHEEYKKK